MSNRFGGMVRSGAVALVLVAGAAGCGDDGGDDAEAGADPSADAASAASEVAECVNLPDCAVEVSEVEGLADGDVVSVRIEGWEPDESTGVSQCEDADDPDNSDLTPGPDGLPPAAVCNVLGLSSPAQTENADANGVLAFDYEVRAGERMDTESMHGLCDAEHDCEIVIFLPGTGRLQSDAPFVTIPFTLA